MRHIYFDLETTARGGPDGMDPSAHWHENEVLLAGWSVDGGEVHTGCIQDLVHVILYYQDEEVLLIAHNAKFDLKYLMRYLDKAVLKKLNIHCTMTGHYLESGLRDKMISLEDLAALYGIHFSKTLDIGALLLLGTKMEDIPEEDLREYLIGDVEALIDICAHVDLETHNYLFPLAEMEMNGLPLHRDRAIAMAAKYETVVDNALRYIKDYIISHCVWQDGTALTQDDFSDLITPKVKCIKPTAARTLSFLFTGCPDVLKVGGKWELHRFTDLSLSEDCVNDIYDGQTPTHLGYPMSDAHLEEIQTCTSDATLVKHVREHRKATKLLNTYLLPMLMQYEASRYGTVHPNLNTATTSTSRLSSSAPNGQNMPAIIRSLIETHKENYEIEEVDLSQLELVAAAALSKDVQLIYDLTHGVDIHFNTASKVFGANKAKAKRKLAKNVNFGVLYGGSANGLSKQTGVPSKTIQELIDAFYERYPDVLQWQDDLFETVKDCGYPYDIKQGEQRYAYDYVIPNSGKKITFVEVESPPWMNTKYSFSPTHTSNYPIQGFAGGDIVMQLLYWLWRNTSSTVHFLLTVHDSIIMEKPEDEDLTHVYDQAMREISTCLKLPVPITYDVEAGPTWR